MGIFKEIPPTSGFSIYSKDVLSLLKIKSYNYDLEQDFKNYLGVLDAKITCSGTAGLYLIAAALKGISPKKTVVIPSYICPSVPLAIAKAGLKVEVCDINGNDFNLKFNELEDLCSKNNDILAIMVAHLGGIPADFDAVARVARKYGIFIVEDCAQSLGALYKGRKTGTLGDFAFFSLARGKGLTIYEGGVIVSNLKEHAAIIEDTMERLVQDNFFSETLKIIELLGYAVFYRPRLFWFVYRLPEIFWDLQGNRLKALTEYFSLDFPVQDVSRVRKLLGHIMFCRLDKEINKQRQKASLYMEALKDVKGVSIVKEPGDSRATYPFLTLIFEDIVKKVKVLKTLQGFGLGVSELYTLPISDYEYLKDFVPQRQYAGASYLANRQITLSTSTFLQDKDLDLVAKAIKNL